MGEISLVTNAEPLKGTRSARALAGDTLRFFKVSSRACLIDCAENPLCLVQQDSRVEQVN